MKFLKFEFLNEAEWLVVRDSLYEDEVLIPEVIAIHEIGHICFAQNEEGECIDLGTKYAVDMLCEAYMQEFCEIYPDSPYCIIPNETISE